MVISANGDFAGILAFGDAPSVMLTVGGTVAATLISFPMPVLARAMKSIGLIFQAPKSDPGAIIENIVKLANIARKEGVLALEESANSMEDKFLQKGVMLIVDGTDPELVRNIMETELAYIDERHGGNIKVWDTIASLAPAWGMMGTLIGLILMLGSMSDPGALGPAMATTIITTFYGSIMANLIAIPTATKLKHYSDQELFLKTVQIEGMLSIQGGENPRIIEEKLKAFISPVLRESVGTEKKEEA